MEAQQGQRVRLRPVDEQDLTTFVAWFNDPEVRYWLHWSERPQETLESQRERYQQHRDHPGWVEWSIESADGALIGHAGLVAIDEVHGRAELYISIGEKEHWGRGLGTDAIRQVLRHAFTEVGLRRVYLITDEDNERGIRCYEKCGFVREGLLRGNRLRYGKPLNMLAMGVLREDWEKEPWR